MTGESGLKAAVQRIRDVSAWATKGPWHVEVGQTGYPQRVCNDAAVIVAQTFIGPGHPPVDAWHIAMWDPAATGAVADLLEAIDRLEPPNRIDVIQAGLMALLLARRILGEDDPSIDRQIQAASEAIDRTAQGVPFEASVVGKWPDGTPQRVQVTLPSIQRVDELERQLAAKSKRVAELERQSQAVLDYVAKLECGNCDHVHNDGSRCAVVREFTGPCRCDWGVNDITKDIRDLLDEGRP